MEDQCLQVRDVRVVAAALGGGTTVEGVLVEPESPTVELSAAFARLQGMLLKTPAATPAVAQLAAVTREPAPMATGAGVTLIDEHGHPATTAATDPAVEALDRTGAHTRLVTSSRLSGIPLLEVAVRVVKHAEEPRR